LELLSIFIQWAMAPMFLLVISTVLAQAVGTQLGVPSLGLHPIGRSYYTTDAEATAVFFTRYFNATISRQNISTNAACAKVTQVLLGQGVQTFEFTFVQDMVKPFGTLTAQSVVATAKEQWNEVVLQHRQAYSPWFDNHDGLSNLFSFDVDRLAEDNVSIQAYHDDNVKFPAAIVRLKVPGTAYTIEMAGNFSIGEARKLEKWIVSDPDNCRNNSASSSPPKDVFWWKATFASADPQAAAEFAVEVLGAYETPAPYPWPLKPCDKNCTGARWVQFRNPFFELHFVKSWEYDPGNLSIAEWAGRQESLRDLEGGVFDQHMYNSLVLWADSLDPFVSRLKERRIAFLALRLSEGLFALYVDIPKNGFVVQIRSNVLTAVEPVGFDACRHSLNAYV